MPNYKNYLLLTGLFAVASFPAAAGVVFSTGVDAGGTNPVYDTTGAIYTRYLQLTELNTGQYLTFAETFSVSSSSTITDLIVALSQPTGTAFHPDDLDFYISANDPTNGQASVGLPADSLGNPLAADVLYSGVATGITGTAPSIYDVSLSGSATLTAGTTYWLLAKTAGTIPYTNCPGATCLNYDDNWYTNTASAKGFGFYDDYASQGWNYIGNATPAYTLTNNSIDAATPEPGTTMLLVTGLVLVVMARFGTRTVNSKD